MSYAHKINPMYELCSYHDNGFIIDELCYIISSMTFIMTPITNQTFPGHSGKSGHLGKAYSHLRIDVDVDDMIQSFIAKNLQPYFSRSFGQFWPLDRLIYCCIKLVFHCKKNSIILSQVIRAILAT